MVPKQYAGRPTPNNALFVLVGGFPGSGKSTLARPLAAELGLCLLVKDEIKEALADALGMPADVEESRRLGRAVLAMLRAARDCHGAVLDSTWFERARLLFGHWRRVCGTSAASADSGMFGTSRPRGGCEAADGRRGFRPVDRSRRGPVVAFARPRGRLPLDHAVDRHGEFAGGPTPPSTVDRAADLRRNAQRHVARSPAGGAARAGAAAGARPHARPRRGRPGAGRQTGRRGRSGAVPAVRDAFDRSSRWIRPASGSSGPTSGRR